MTVVLNFIPNVGSIIATVLPIPIILVSPDVSRSEAVLALVLPGIIHFFVGNVLEPQLLGDTMDLSPVVVLLSLTVWTALWGGIGALLAVPITAVIQILCEKLDFTRPIAEVLRGNFLDLLDTEKTERVSAASMVSSSEGETLVNLEIAMTEDQTSSGASESQAPPRRLP